MKNCINYTIDTLAIEFNRGTDQIKLALDVLMELEMIEIIEDNVYRVKNFAKHQNIKVKEEIKAEDKEEENSKNEVYNNEKEKSESKVSHNELENIKNSEVVNLEMKNTKRENKRKKNDIIFEFTDEENEDNQIDGFRDEEIPLGKDDSIIAQRSFA